MSYLVLFFQNRSSSPKDVSKRHILHWSGASELLTLISHEVLLDWEVIAKSVSSLIRLFAMHELFSGSWSFHLLEDAAEPSPLSPLIDVTTKQSIWTSMHSFLFVITTHNVSTNEGNNRFLWGETPQACPQCYYHQLRNGLQSLPTPTDHHQCPS